MQVARKDNPEELAKLVGSYTELLEESLEQQMYRVERDTSRKIAAFAEALVARGAGPRDIIEIHTASLASLLAATGLGLGRSRAYGEEARLVLVEVMGHMITEYRVLALRGTPQRG